MLSSLGSVALVLAVLGGMLWWLRRSGAGSARGRFLSMVDSIGLGGERGLSVVRAGNRYFLMGATREHISLIAEIEAQEVPEVLRSQPPAGPLRGGAWWPRGRLQPAKDLTENP